MTDEKIIKLLIRSNISNEGEFACINFGVVNIRIHYRDRSIKQVVDCMYKEILDFVNPPSVLEAEI